jgi:hypothetical protein
MNALLIPPLFPPWSCAGRCDRRGFGRLGRFRRPDLSSPGRSHERLPDRIGDGTPTALATDSYLPADCPEYFTCTPGQKIAVIQEAAGGKLSVTEVA